MMRGSVNADGEAVLPVRVRGFFGDVLRLDAVIDTGFNGPLTLSAEQVGVLQLPPADQGQCILADGSSSVMRSYYAEVEWFGRWQRITVIESPGGPLIGTELLEACHLGIDMIDGGLVEVRPLEPAPEQM
jgi:clan AA aspartic protease